MGVDYRVLQAFRDRLGKAEYDAWMDACCRELAARLLGAVIHKTPVDDGYLRRGWTGGTAAAGETYARSLPIRRAGASYVIEIVNPVEYASYVEFGHRQTPGRFVPGRWEGSRFIYDPDAEGGMVLKQGWVEGRFMLTQSENEIRSLTPTLLQKRLKQKMMEVLSPK